MVHERMLAKAIDIAAAAHCGQVDRGGQPYIFHPLRVMMAGRTWDERIVGVLHDVLEDTMVTEEDLEEACFDDTVIEAVKALTRDEEKETYPEFIDRVIDAGIIAIKVKLADMNDNLSPSRMDYLPDEEQKRLHEKYDLQRVKLQNALQWGNTRVK